MVVCGVLVGSMLVSMVCLMMWLSFCFRFVFLGSGLIFLLLCLN